MSDLARAQRRIEERRAKLGIASAAPTQQEPRPFPTLAPAIAALDPVIEQPRETPRAPAAPTPNGDGPVRDDREAEDMPPERAARPSAPATRGRRGGARPKRDRSEPPIDLDAEAADPGYPRIGEGLYSVALVSCVQRELWGRWRWLLTWAVVEGPEQGVELPQYLPRPKDPTARPRPGWALSAAYRVARGERLPRNLARLNPRVFLDGSVFEARVRDVERDSFGAKVAPAARYSRIANLERRVTGKGGSP